MFFINRLATPLAKGYIFTTIEELRKEWLFTVAIKPHGINALWFSTIIDMKTKSGDIVCKISFKTASTKLAIFAAVNGTSEYIPSMTSYDSLPLGQYSTIKFYHIYDKVREAYVIEVVVNGILYGTTVNTAPKTFQDVEVYTSSEENPPSDADIKELYILNI